MFIKICAICIISAAVYAVVNSMSGSIPFAVKLGGLVLAGGVIAVMAEPVISRIYELSALGEGIREYSDVVVRALGVAILAHLCSDVCRDCGENSAASYVILAAKIEIVILCLPLVEKIISYGSYILKMQ